MNRTEDGFWSLTMFIPDKAEFLYQFLLLKMDEDPMADPQVVWEGGLQRKSRNGETPSPKISPTGEKHSSLVFDSAVSESTPEKDRLRADLGHLPPTERELEILRREKEKCQNELQKLKDIVGFAQVSELAV